MVSGVFLVVFLLSCIHVVDGLDEFQEGVCITLDGHSVGSHNFCDRCENASRDGVGVFWNGKSTIWSKINPKSYSRIKGDEDIGVTMTTITIDGVELEGWYHITLKMPERRNVYAFIFQMEDNAKSTPAGEFTTELLSACQGGNLETVPTAAQILPCHAASKYSTTVPNALVYWREANVTEGIIRSNTPPSEFHVNWKVPPISSCSPNSQFAFRLKFMTLPSNETFRSCMDDGKDCPIQKSRIHNHILFALHLSPPSLKKEFHYAHPVPLFYSAVNCTHLIPVDNITNIRTRFIEDLNKFVPVPPPAPCVYGNGVVPPGETFDATLSKQPRRSLYLGRCTNEKDKPVGPEFPFPSECDPPNTRQDFDFIESLVTVTEYIEGVRYDLCGCDSVGTGVVSPDGGSLSLGSGASAVAPAPPPPDYPVESSLSRSGSIPLGVSEKNTISNSTTRETPLQKIHRKVDDSRVLHAQVSSIVFTFLIPISNFCARYMKESFYRDRAIIDRWYKIHLAGTGLTFVCFMVGQFTLYAGNFWNVLLVEPVENPKSRLHGQIGWVVLGLYAFLMITGGLRPYNPNSTTCLKITMGVHAILGFTFYYMGLTAMLLYLIDHFLAMVIVLSWIVIDALFHFIMTGLVICTNRQLNLERSWFPVMELMFDRRNGPGKTVRKRLFELYVVLSLITTGVTFYYIRRVVYAQASSMNRTLLKSANRSGIVYY